jgi:hypothetical protein
MTALPVAFYLKELSGETSRRGGRGFGTLGPGEASDLDVRLDDAHARGVLEGRAAAQVEHAAAAAAQEALFEQRLVSERQTWAAEHGGLLAEQIAAAFEEIEHRVANQVSEILKPVLSEQVRLKAVEELARSLNGMLAKGEYAKVTISGPADLLARMEERLAGGGHGGLSFAAAEGADITVSADDTILATRIGSWADVIAGAGS